MDFNDLKERVFQLKEEEHSVVDIVEILCEETDNQELFDHMEHVATLAGDIAAFYKLDEEAAYTTGILHDIGRLVEGDSYLEILEAHHVAVDDKEKQVFDVLHCKVATVICDEIFAIEDDNIHNGLLYHKTLRGSPSDFEKVIFLADKMTWAYDELVFNIEESVFQSLNVACYHALEWLMNYIKKKKGVFLEDTLLAFDYFKNRMLL